MSLTIKGTLKQKLEIEQGTSKAGKEWKSQSFVVNTGAQYNPDICFKLFGEDKINLINNLNDGDEVEVAFNLSSREWNGKWFTSADAWKIDKTESISNTDETVNNTEVPVFDNNHTEEDDLPF
tara:strand:- start:90 stop:458 length:369 start_codon:yes stop_codon:yes gene_type:complete